MNTFATLKTKRWFRIVLIICKVLVVIVTLGYLLNLFLTLPNFWDDKIVNDADLQFEKITPRENENVANFLPIKNNATEAEMEILASKLRYEKGRFYKKPNEFLEEEIVSEQELKKYITDTKPLVEKFVVASKKLYYQCPIDVLLYPALETCNLSILRNFAILVTFHVEYALSINDVNRAQILVSSLLNVGHMVVEQEVPQAFIEHLVGRSIMDNAIKIIESNPILQKMFQPTIKKYSVSNYILSSVMISEYQSIKSIVKQKDRMVTQGLEKFMDGSSYYWRPNMTFNVFAENTRLSIVTLETPCGITPDVSKQEALLKEYYPPSSNTDIIIRFLKPNFVGGIILQRTLAQLSSLRDDKCKFNTRIEKLSNPG